MCDAQIKSWRWALQLTTKAKCCCLSCSYKHWNCLCVSMIFFISLLIWRTFFIF